MNVHIYNSTVRPASPGVTEKYGSAYRQHRYDNTYIFQELDYINKLRNRIAHHEPICFARPNAVTDASYVLNQYARIMKLFNWMGIDGPSLVYGLDHVAYVSGKMMCI